MVGLHLPHSLPLAQPLLSSASAAGFPLTFSLCFAPPLVPGGALIIATQAVMAYHQWVCKHAPVQ